MGASKEFSKFSHFVCHIPCHAHQLSPFFFMQKNGCCIKTNSNLTKSYNPV